MSTDTFSIDFNFYWLLSLAQCLQSLLTLVGYGIESILFRLVQWSQSYIKTPLEIHLSPLLARIPRSIQIGDNNVIVFNANLITYSRTLLIIPIGWSLKYDYSAVACSLVVLQGCLDHVDGIVAKVQNGVNGEKLDDSLLGDFLDGFCDKIVNVFCLWTIIQAIHLDQTSILISIAFVLLCYTTMGVEIALAIVRTQDYFYCRMKKNKKSSFESTTDVMEEKLKETIKSLAMASLCLSTGHREPFHHWSGLLGTVGLFLTVRFAYASLIKTIEVRKQPKETKKSVAFDRSAPTEKTVVVFKSFTNSSKATESRKRAMTLNSSIRENEKQTPSTLSSTPRGSTTSISSGQTPPIPLKSATNPIFDHLNEIQEEKTEFGSTTSSCSDIQHELSHTYQRSTSLPAIWIDGRADKVYTVGCFDLFHEGHRLLLQRMRQFGREVIVGVHDSRSIHKLKSRVPVDGTETRMLNVKRYADQVYCVAGTDPSNFISCIVHLRENETAVYVRGDDMAEFPSRRVVEDLMPVKFLPYTSGVSSTQLRKELFSHIQSNDLEHLEKVN